MANTTMWTALTFSLSWKNRKSFYVIFFISFSETRLKGLNLVNLEDDRAFRKY